jgi:hypothetical protein
MEYPCLLEKNIKINAVCSGTSFTWNINQFVANDEYHEWCDTEVGVRGVCRDGWHVWWYWARKSHKCKVKVKLFLYSL